MGQEEKGKIIVLLKLVERDGFIWMGLFSPQKRI